jgi:GntR family transcriptional repressor for pyruvate dehydrogenase complex
LTSSTNPGTSKARNGVPALHREAKKASTTLSNVIAQKLRDGILSGEYPVGTPLGSERFLMEKYRCGRASVREALRVLRGQDMIEVRRGRSGGWFILNPSQDGVVNSLDRLIAGQNFRLIDLVFAREAIEGAAAVQAAQYGDPEKIDALRIACVECENNVLEDADFVQANLDWHLALAEASGNPLFVTFLRSISKAMHLATDLEQFDLGVRKAVVGIHWQIYNAIATRDPEAAHRRTLRHLNAYRSKLATIDDIPVEAI